MKNWKKTFAVIWFGQFFSAISSNLVGFACVLWLSLETRSAQVLAISAIASMLPQALLGPFTGVLVDRLPRKRLMIGSDLFIAFWSLIMAVLFFTGNQHPGYIYALLALRSLGNAFYSPSMQASVPLLAPEDKFTKIAGINQTIFSVSNIAGPALGALMVSTVNMGYVILLDVAGAVIACTSLLFVHIPNPEKKNIDNPHIIREMREGFHIIIKNKGIAYIFLLSMIFMLVLMPIAVIFPLITLEYFKGNAYDVSIVEIFWGIGMIAGGLIMGIKQFKMNEVILKNIMYIIAGITFLISAVLPPTGFACFVGLTAIGAVTAAVDNSLFAAILQKNVRAEALGRVFSLYFSIAVLPSLIGLTAMGVIADSLGLMNSLLISGALIVLIGIAAMFIKPMIQLGTKPHAQP